MTLSFFTWKTFHFFFLFYTNANNLHIIKVPLYRIYCQHVTKQEEQKKNCQPEKLVVKRRAFHYQKTRQFQYVQKNK